MFYYIEFLLSNFIFDFSATLIYKKINIGENMKNVSGIEPEAVKKLQNFNWPGNIRQLRNCVEKMVVLAAGEILTVADVPQLEPGTEAEDKNIVTVDPLNLENSEKELIRKALAECGNNRAAAARKLGISRRTLYRKLEELANE